MIYPDSYEEKIGFQHIRSMLKNECVSVMGSEKVDKISYTTDFKYLTNILGVVKEFQEILLFDDPFPIQGYNDLRKKLSFLSINGTFLDLEDCALLRDFIGAVVDVYVYLRIRNENNKYANLWAHCQNLFLEKEILNIINKVVDPKGNLKDNASVALQTIRRNMIKISAEADKKIRQLLTKSKKEGLINEDAEMTVRNNRLCIPVPAVYKRRFKGFIHDESSTGQTVFMEPSEVFDINNELRDLANAEKREITRILTEISEQIRPSIPNLKEYHNFLGEIDFIRAKAKFGISINGIVPNIIDKPLINWIEATHPLLFLNNKNSNKKVIPVTVALNENSRILIISGPNAGGKSVCLKTVGLLQYMIQCGIPVSMKEISEMGIFCDFFIDIGDEQSIENDLSTYSCHLVNIKNMIENMNERSIFLIDEFGSGTEPTLGAAIAEAALEKIYSLKSFGIITTHYANLKHFPDIHKDSVCGAMLFDTSILKPLFILKLGVPGSSFTYDIARQTGFPEEIIKSAIQKSGTNQIDYEKKLEEIEIVKIEVNNKLKMINHADEQLALLIQEYDEKYSMLEKQRKEILQNAKYQAIDIINRANKAIEKTIREIKEVKADPGKTKEIRKKLNEEKNNIETTIKIEPVSLPKPLNIKPKNSIQKNIADKDSKIVAGDFVLMADTQTVGNVLTINGRDVAIAFNSITLKTTIDKLVKISKKEAKQTLKYHTGKLDGNTISDVVNKKLALFIHTLDIRGKRVEEVVPELDSYLDEAVLIGVKNVKILHGKGNGILRLTVRQYLGKRKEIVSFQDEQLEYGGSGITVVNIK